MKHFIISLFLGISLSFSALAETPAQPTNAIKLQREMVCVSTDQIKQLFGETYGEFPGVFGAISAQDDFNAMLITVHPQTKDWSLILIRQQSKIGCVVATGSALEFNLKIIFPGGQIVSF